ncbi:MAG: hypothetical protein K6U12_05390 [Armatimonadetes bacterium]|nr:hypothetical protein [Armatimonadota bacterium]
MSKTELIQRLRELYERAEQLRAEWKALPKRMDSALLAGDKDALIDCQIRQRQIPYEYARNLRERAEVWQAYWTEEQKRLEREIEALKPKYEKARERYEKALAELRAVEQEYRALGGVVSPLEGVPPGSKLHEVLYVQLIRGRSAIGSLERILHRVGEGDSKAIGIAIDGLEQGDKALEEFVKDFLVAVSRLLERGENA